MLTFGAVGDTGYDIMLFLHILTMFAAFAPAFIIPFIDNGTRSPADASVRQRFFQIYAPNARRIHGGTLILGGLLGFGVAGMSDEVFKLSEPWLAISVVLWVAMNGVLHAVIAPTERAIAEGDETNASRLEQGGAIMTVLFLATLYLMVFQPGQ
ncbi:MAG: hypothetical protein HKN26_12395 [Acidimicrobiales bacterium]|nr:hypothetical protein [Acidimicrobiales bacterium]